MCEYCDETGVREAISCAAGNTIGIPKDNMLVAQSHNTRYIYVRINYCPMCGRKLEGKE